MKNTSQLNSHRICVIWDVEANKCDQKMSKEARIALFYRPASIGSSRDENTDECFGQTLCMTRYFVCIQCIYLCM